MDSQEDPKKLSELDENTFVGYDRLSLGREFLPISKHKLEILYSIENYSCTIIIAETGSGKTTQIPQFLYEAGYTLENKQIAITLPRRVAAISVANRVAHEMDSILGLDVGYHVRFDEKYTEKTSIKFMTDGIMIQEMMQDPLLTKYSVIMIDDIHDRTINSDILIALLKKIRNKRPDLKLIVSSATLDAEKISNYFTNKENNFISNILHIEGRVFPVDIFYLRNSCKNYVVEAAKLAWYIHVTKSDGDLLVFLTGQEEIEVFLSLITNKFEFEMSRKQNLKKICCLPLYAGLPLEIQMKVFDKISSNTRKIIAATNIAESSVTINGIVYVIDSCLVKVKHYDFQRDYESLVVIPISKSAANQRAGRAGRVQPGECYRLCTKSYFDSNFFENSTPEILRSKLENTIMQIKALGVSNLIKFDFLDKPNEGSFIRALELLYSLEVLDKEGNLTKELGVKAPDLPLDIKLAVLFLNSFKEEFSCSKEILILVSLIASGNIWYLNNSPVSVLKAKKRLGAKEGDLITNINVYLKFNKINNKNERRKFCNDNGINENIMNTAKKINEQLQKYIKKHNLEIKSASDDIEAILRCITSSFFSNAAQRQPNGNYKSITTQEILTLHPSSILTVLYPEWIIYLEIVKTEKFFMRECIEIDYKWLLELAPHYYQDNKTQLLEAKHLKEINEHIKFENEKNEKIVEIAVPKEAPRYNKILNNLKENLDKGKVFKKENVKELKNQKNMLSFDFEDI